MASTPPTPPPPGASMPQLYLYHSGFQTRYTRKWFTIPKRKVVLRICSFVHHLSVAIVQLEVAKYSHFQILTFTLNKFISVDLNKLIQLSIKDRTSNALANI